MLMLSKFIGKVFALCSDSSKNRELREIVFISSSQSILSPMRDAKEFEVRKLCSWLLHSSMDFARQVHFIEQSRTLVDVTVFKLSLGAMKGTRNRVQLLYAKVTSRFESQVHFTERFGRVSFWGKTGSLVVSGCMLAIALRVLVLTILINILKYWKYPKYIWYQQSTT